MNSMLKSVALVATLCLSSFASADVDDKPLLPKQALSQVVDDFELSLINQEKEHCAVKVKTAAKTDKTIPLLLNSPCYWVTNSQSELLQYAYADIEVDTTLLVGGTRLEWPKEKLAYQKLPEDSYCSAFLQGLVIHKGDVFAVDEKMVGAHCESGLAMDEKIFYAIAHNTNRYQLKEPTTPEATAEINSEPIVATEEKPEEEKSFIESMTDSIKSLVSSEKDAEYYGILL